jgi:signal transduction histidine kinase
VTDVVSPSLDKTGARRAWSELLRRLDPYLPRWQSRQFWAVQALVIFIAAGHATLEAIDFFHNGSTTALELSFLPAAFFLIPATYAALNFGTVGAVATVAWSLVISLPAIVFFSDDQDWVADLVQLAAVAVTTFFVGQRTDRELAAKRRVEMTAAALRSSELKYRRLFESSVRAQEAERQRIARDLHDQTVQELILLCRRLDVVESVGNVSPAARDTLSDARKTAEEIVGDLRDFARSLRPPTLDDLGLVTAIGGLLRDLTERAKIEGNLSLANGEKRLEPDVELTIFRIVQEALHNVERHARATRVTVTIAFVGDVVRVDVADDGAGFATSPTTDFAADGHLGLLGMRERAESLGGRLEIVSQSGHGTRVTVTLSHVAEVA